jgi:predicted kinase
MDVVIFIGLQGAGKSSFYRARFADTHAHISKDRFRNNRRPARRQRQLIEEALQASRSVVVDNTNPTIDDRREPIELAHQYGARVIGYFFDSDLDACLARNRERTGKERVPDEVLTFTLRRLQAPSSAEGFGQLYRVRLVEGTFEVTVWEGETGNESG